MQTISISVMNLMAPCGCACRYCLLHSRKTAEGVDYFRGKAFAERMVAWARQNAITPLPYYTVAYCAEYPELLDNIAFNRTVDSFGAKFLQCNGIRLRTPAELDTWLDALRTAGVESIDTTFFGTRDYHDTFAARQGDFDFMLLLASRASAHGITCSPSAIVSQDNLGMLDELLETLQSLPGIGPVQTFIPDHRGRGYLMEPSRITLQDYEHLSDAVKQTLNISRYKTQRDWLSMESLPEYTQRAVTITLREDNIEFLESMRCDEVVAYVERLDDAFYAAIPTVNELAAMYGDPENERLYRVRDLFWMWQQRYIRDNRLSLYDVTDERNCYTIRS